jgi:hypothetical protein
MFLAYLTLLSGLFISAVAIFYSVSGLTSIFSAAVIPIIVMGTSLEVGKLVASVWLKQNWTIAPKWLRTYLIIAVAILMLITSMGIFGFLSKAHLDQTMVSGDSQDKVAMIDEKIKTQRDNIEAASKALKQMDAQVDEKLSRTTDDKGADKAVQIRRSQARERSNLQNDISKAQKEIASLNEQRIPMAKELRKVEAEVGPIKYVAQLIYGDTVDQNILDRAVRWVIIMLVMVFDPLAVILLLASQYSFGMLRKDPNYGKSFFSPTPESPTPTTNADEYSAVKSFFERGKELARSLDKITGINSGAKLEEIDDHIDPPYELDDGPLTDEELAEIKQLSGLDQTTTEPEIDQEDVDPEIFEEPEEVVEQIKTLTGEEDSSKAIEGWNTMLAQAEKAVEEDPEDIAEESTTTVTHTTSSMIITDQAGTQEIPAPRPVVKAINSEYVTVDGKVYHHKAFDHESESAAHLEEKHSVQTYVQNEEQSESDQWTKIAKPITEKEYLEAAKQNQTKDGA